MAPLLLDWALSRGLCCAHPFRNPVAEDARTTATCATIEIEGAGEKSGTYEWDGCGTVNVMANEYSGTVNTFVRIAEDGSSYVLAVNPDIGGAWELGGLPLYRVSRSAPYIHILDTCARMHYSAGRCSRTPDWSIVLSRTAY